MPRSWLRYPLIGLPSLILVLWLYIAGSYSPLRDLVGIVLVTLGITAYQAWRWGGTAEVAAASTWTSLPQLALPLRSFRWLLACWVTLSLLDVAFAPRPLALRGRVAAPPAMPATSGKLRVGLALSGGGYRAALVHAGVLQELAARGIPVTNIASVSGGSIIGSFIGQGGDPADFIAAAKEGRFRFKRDLLSALNLPRWLFPFGSFSRRDVQAGLVRRVLLSAEPLPGSRRPALMLAMTDLSNAMSVGATDHGFMLAGPTTSRFFKSGEAMAIDGLADLANKVAISGAFPGAFPAYQTSARFTQTYEPLSPGRPGRTIPMALVDGGVFDNLGLTLLQTIDQEARGTGNNSLPWPLFQPGPDWALDVIIISDGGQSLVAVEKPLWLLSQAWRAIEVSGLGTGILRLIRTSAELPVISLSVASELALSPDAVIAELLSSNPAAGRRRFFQPQRLSDNDLARIVDLVPARAQARQALADYRRTRKGLLNIGDVDTHCAKPDPAYRDSAECHWRALADIALDDIERITGIFRSSATLEDAYSQNSADALVRFGRYLVLIKAAEIDEKITAAAARKP